MSSVFYIDNPETLALETRPRATRPGQVLLECSPFFPGGGGQLPDRGQLIFNDQSYDVAGFEKDGSDIWVLLSDETAVIRGPLLAQVDEPFRNMMRNIHTATHVLNAVIFHRFEDALVTGVQMNADGTARMDFNLPQIDNDHIRSLEPEINGILSQSHEIVDEFVDYDSARKEKGLIRSYIAAPPRSTDNLLRIVHIDGIDRQACGGTHLANTRDGAAIRITKIENKGRQNRRVKISLDKRKIAQR